MAESSFEPDVAILPFPSQDDARRRAEARSREPKLRHVLGQVLRDERTEQGRTLADVARSASVSLPYLSEVERGRKDVSSDVLTAIGVALELDVAEILERSARRLRASNRVRMKGIQLRLAA